MQLEGIFDRGKLVGLEARPKLNVFSNKYTGNLDEMRKDENVRIPQSVSILGEKRDLLADLVCA